LNDVCLLSYVLPKTGCYVSKSHATAACFPFRYLSPHVYSFARCFVMTHPELLYFLISGDCMNVICLTSKLLHLRERVTCKARSVPCTAST